MSSIRKNSFLGLLGFAVPTVILVVAYPVLVLHLGLEAFGIFILSSSLTGSLAFLDFGFSAATLKFVAEDMAKNDKKSVAEILSASLLFYGGVGLLLIFVFWTLSPWLVSLFAIEAKLATQAIWAFRLSSIQLGAFFLLSVFISLFKGMHRFGLSTLALSALSLLTYGISVVAVLVFNAGLVEICLIGLFANLLVLSGATIVARSLCHTEGILLKISPPSFAVYKKLFNFGSALTITAIAGVLNSQIQRIVVGMLLGPQSVAAFHLGTFPPARASSATMAFSEPLFPKVASTAGSDKGHLRRLYLRYVLIVIAISAAMLLPFMIFPNLVYSLWLQGEVPHDVPKIAAIFSAGLLVNAAGQPAHHFINGLGKQWINTFYSIVNPLALYAILLWMYLVHDSITVIDFAWATTVSLAITSAIYLTWYELKISGGRFSL